MSNTELLIEEKKALKEAFRTIQEQSLINGTDKMTLEEINAEIAAYRQEKNNAKK